jgi:Arc/MetJ family transcription regulator
MRQNGLTEIKQVQNATDLSMKSAAVNEKLRNKTRAVGKYWQF